MKSIRLGMVPDRAIEIGDAVSSRPGSSSLRRTRAVWGVDSTANREGNNVSAHLQELYDLMESKRDALVGLASAGYKLEWFCFISEDGGQGGVELSHSLLADLATLPVDLVLDIYASPEGPSDPAFR